MADRGRSLDRKKNSTIHIFFNVFNVQALNLYLTIYTETEGTRYLSYIKAGTFWV
jgi:hypothetical protein